MEEINLLESTTFIRTIKCQLPGKSADTLRDFTFKATYKVMPQDDWEELCANSTKSEAVREVLAEVDGIPSASQPGGVTFTPVDVAVKNPFTCDAIFSEYALFISENGRKAAQAAAERKNSKRSRGR